MFEPMLAVRRYLPFDDERWWFEVKWDGYRAIVGAENGMVRARSWVSWRRRTMTVRRSWRVAAKRI